MQEETNPTDLEAAQAARDLSERAEQAAREVEISDFKWLMQDERGRRFVWRLMREGKFLVSPFNSDALEMARSAGRREQAIALMNELLTLCPEKWLEMINDQKRR